MGPIGPITHTYSGGVDDGGTGIRDTAGQLHIPQRYTFRVTDIESKRGKRLPAIRLGISVRLFRHITGRPLDAAGKPNLNTVENKIPDRRVR